MEPEDDAGGNSGHQAKWNDVGEESAQVLTINLDRERGHFLQISVEHDGIVNLEIFDPNTDNDDMKGEDE